MHRTTVMIPEALKVRAQLFARERGLSFGELVRECLERRLDREAGADHVGDPLFSAPPWTGDTPSDLAKDHDRYLYDE